MLSRGGDGRPEFPLQPIEKIDSAPEFPLARRRVGGQLGSGREQGRGPDLLSGGAIVARKILCNPLKRLSPRPSFRPLARGVGGGIGGRAANKAERPDVLSRGGDGRPEFPLQPVEKIDSAPEFRLRVGGGRGVGPEILRRGTESACKPLTTLKTENLPDAGGHRPSIRAAANAPPPGSDEAAGGKDLPFPRRAGPVAGYAAFCFSP